MRRLWWLAQKTKKKKKKIQKGPNRSGRTVKNTARIVDKWVVKMWVNS